MTDNPLTLTGSLDNTSTITTSTAAYAVQTSGALTANIINSGSINSTDGLVAIGLAGELTGTITNGGTIEAAGLNSPGSAGITGIAGILVVGGVSGGINNSGTIALGPTSAGTASPGTFSNSVFSAAPAPAAIYLGSGSTNITNNKGGIIEDLTGGQEQAIQIDAGASSNIINEGTIAGSLAIEWSPATSVALGSLNNEGIIESNAVTDGTALLTLNAGLSGGILNSGTITAANTSTNVYTDASATIDIAEFQANVTNTATGLIAATGAKGSVILLEQASASSVISNAGTISGTGAGGEAIVNMSGAAQTITNSGTIAQTAGIAIDDSQATASTTITTSGSITGSIELSPQADVLTITGGTIAGDILATAAGHGTVDIAVGAGNSFTAGGKIGDPAGFALAALNIDSGTLLVGAAGVNALAITIAAAATLVTTAGDTLTGSLTDNGTIEANAGTLTLEQAVSGSGTLKIDADATLALAGALAAGGTVSFAGSGAALELSAPSKFSGAISGFTVGDSIDLVNTTATAIALNSSNQLVVSNAGGTVATLDLTGSYSGGSSHFVLASDGAGGTTITLSTAAETSAQAFAAAQNAARGSSGIALDYAGTAAPGGNAVIGFQSDNFSSGDNAMVLDGPRSQYAVSVSGSGAVSITDNVAHQTVTDTGISYILFGGGATTTTGGVTSYANIYFIDNAANSQVAAFYDGVLGRQPDLAGLEYWQNQLSSGQQTMAGIAAAFLNSAEFLARFPSASAPADHGGANDSAFVTALYENILDRAPDAAGLAYWVGQLAGTSTRTSVLLSFTGSTENLQNISAANGGWLIDTALGNYSDATTSAQTATAMVGLAAQPQYTVDHHYG